MEFSFRNFTRKFGAVGLLGLLWSFLPGLLGLYVVARLGTLAEILTAYRPWSAPLWAVAMALAIGIGLLPVYSNTFLCGWVFGWGWGCLWAMLSYLGAATLGYYLAHRLSRERIVKAIEEHEGARRVSRALLHESRRRAVLIIALWRLSGSPFPLTNLVMASCGVPKGTYFMGTIVGLTPRIVIGTLVSSTAAGTGARDLQTLVRDSQHPALLLLGLLASLLVLVLIGHIARTTLRKMTEAEKQAAKE